MCARSCLSSHYTQRNRCTDSSDGIMTTVTPIKTLTYFETFRCRDDGVACTSTLLDSLPLQPQVIQSLTTTLTPPSSCFDPTYTLAPEGNDKVSGAVVKRGIQQTCYPPSFYLTQTNTQSYSAAGFYSPGVCPSGYATPTTSTSYSTTFATCCPL